MRKIVFIVLMVFASIYSYSCDCALQPTLDSATKNSVIILSGTLLRQELVDVLMQDTDWILLDRNDERIHTSPYVVDYIKYSFRIAKAYKGYEKGGETIDVYSPAAATACGYMFSKGKTYIVYGDNVEFQVTGGKKVKGVLTTTCDRTMLFNELENSNLKGIIK